MFLVRLLITLGKVGLFVGLFLLIITALRYFFRFIVDTFEWNIVDHFGWFFGKFHWLKPHRNAAFLISIFIAVGTLIAFVVWGLAAGSGSGTIIP